MSTTSDATEPVDGYSAAAPAARALECGMCLESFSAIDPEKQPVIIVPCGHSVCKACGVSLMTVLPLRCPFDRIAGTPPLIKNFALIEQLGLSPPPEDQLDAAARPPAACPYPPSAQRGCGRSDASSTLSAEVALFETLRSMSKEDREATFECTTTLDDRFDHPPKSVPAPRPRIGRIPDGDSRSHLDAHVSAKIGAPGELRYPSGVAVDDDGRIVIVDCSDNCVKAFLPNGRRDLTFGRRGSGRGEFEYPHGVAIDRQGHIIVADGDNRRFQTFDHTGQFLRSSSRDSVDKYGCFRPYGIAVDPRGAFIVTVDPFTHRVDIFASPWILTRSVGGRGKNPGEFDHPQGVAVNNDGFIIVADTMNNRIQVLSPDGYYLHHFTKDVRRLPTCVAVDSANCIVVAYENSSYIEIFSPEGALKQQIGFYSITNCRLQAGGIAVDGEGQLVVSNIHDGKIYVLRVGRP